MSESTNLVAAVTRNFLVDTDDLVDELLSAINSCDWKNLKMQYQLSRLEASKPAPEPENTGKFDLHAEWNELDEEVQLRIAITGTEASLPSRQQECLEVMNALFPNDIFRKVNEDN
jgi:hypothetical protein